MWFAPLWPVIVAALTWLLRQIVVKFMVLAAVVALVVFLMPMVWSLVQPYTGIDLASYFGGLSPTLWWWLDVARLDVGLPTMLSAIVARFLIRRLPIVG